MSGVTSMFESPSKQATAAATANQGLTEQTVAQAEKYTNQAGTNEQNAVANAGPNPYFGAAANMNPSAYAVNPSNTTTFGENGPPGTTSGGGYAISNPFTSPTIPATTPGAGQATRSTQPIAVNPHAQSVAQSSENTTVPVQSANNPFSNGKRNTATIASLLGL